MNPHSHAVAPVPTTEAASAWLVQPVAAAGFGVHGAKHSVPVHHSHGHAHAHDHAEHGHGTGHSHSHSHDDHHAPAEKGRASGHSHAHSHDDHEHGHAHGHAHSHSAVEPKKAAPVVSTPTPAVSMSKPVSMPATPKESGRATGHSHSHSDKAEQGRATGHSHSHGDEKEHGKACGHSHAHSDKKEQGHASGHSHSHSSSAAHEEHGHAHGHSHAHGDHEGHDHSASTNVGLMILAGMFTFFLIEKTARAHSGGEGGHGHSHGGGHGHSHGPAKPAVELPTTTAFAFGNADDAEEEEEEQDEKDGGMRSRKAKPAAAPKAKSVAVAAAPAAGPTSDQRITGILNLIGDFSHNFTDGMAIAASYLAGGSIGLSTTLAVLIHEVPHEIGDFAILLQSGFTVGDALKAQLLTALGALGGCCFGYWSGATGEAAQSSWIIPFTAGGFIYVALVNVIPTLLPHQSLKQTLTECCAMFLGVSLMVAIAAFE